MGPSRSEDEHHCGKPPAGWRRRRQVTMRITLAPQRASPNHSRSSASVAVFGRITPCCADGTIALHATGFGEAATATLA